MFSCFWQCIVTFPILFTLMRPLSKFMTFKSIPILSNAALKIIQQRTESAVATVSVWECVCVCVCVWWVGEWVGVCVGVLLCIICVFNCVYVYVFICVWYVRRFIYTVSTLYLYTYSIKTFSSSWLMLQMKKLNVNYLLGRLWQMQLGSCWLVMRLPVVLCPLSLISWQLILVYKRDLLMRFNNILRITQ